MNSPNPDWKPGDVLTSPVQKMLTLDAAAMTAPDLYKIIIGCIVPRPIAWVSTMNAAGQGNLAPFSFFNGISSNPPCVVISVSRKGGGEKKDTLRNIEDTGEFVVNSANRWSLEPLVYSAAEFPYGTDEMVAAGLTPADSVRVRPKRVQEAAWQFECRTYKMVEVGDGSAGSSTLIIGQIVTIHIAEQAYQNGRVNFDALSPVARIGGFGYVAPGEQFEIPVPKV